MGWRWPDRSTGFGEAASIRAFVSNACLFGTQYREDALSRLYQPYFTSCTCRVSRIRVAAGYSVAEVETGFINDAIFIGFLYLNTLENSLSIYLPP